MAYKVLSSYYPILKQLPETDAVCTLMFQKRTSSSGKLSHLTPIRRAKSPLEPMSVRPWGHPPTRCSSATWHEPVQHRGAVSLHQEAHPVRPFDFSI